MPGARPRPAARLEARPLKAETSAMKNSAPTSLKHHFLIAMPHMADPHFAQTVTYLVEHNEQGAMGLVINKPNGLNLADVMEQLRPDDEPSALCHSLPIFAGGPVQTDRGFV